MPSDTVSGEESPELLNLSSEPLPVGEGRLSRVQLDRWTKLYRKGARQIRRWIEKGKEKREACPLDNPSEMPAWWERHMTWSVPDEILAAAHAARVDQETQTIPPALSALAPPVAPDSSKAPAAAPGPPIDLADYDLEEGEAVRLQRRLVKASYDQLERAYKGEGGNIDVLQTKFNKAAEALRKIEKDDRTDRERSGALIKRLSIERDLANGVELLRQMRESMVRRVLEICPSLSAEQREEVGTGIIKVREHEDRVFRNLESLKRPADVVDSLAA